VLLLRILTLLGLGAVHKEVNADVRREDGQLGWSCSILMAGTMGSPVPGVDFPAAGGCGVEWTGEGMGPWGIRAFRFGWGRLGCHGL
jgi:hypothetical protein